MDIYKFFQINKKSRNVVPLKTKNQTIEENDEKILIRRKQLLRVNKIYCYLLLL